MQTLYLVDITGMDDVMPGGRDGDENGGAVLAHLRLQAHLSSRGLAITFLNALPFLQASKCSGHEYRTATKHPDPMDPNQCCGSGIVLVRIWIIL